jgi:hypothetical protein
MSYILGATTVTSSLPFVLTPTAEGDGWTTLLAAYRTAFPAGTTETAFARAVCAANGIPFTTAAIEAWIFGLSGKRLPFSAADNPGKYGGPKNVGYAFFGEGNMIKLPDMARLDGKGPKKPSADVLVPPSPTVRSEEGPNWLLIGGIGLLAALAFAATADKKKKPVGGSLAAAT